MTADDLEDVVRIEELSFSRPWSRQLFENELKNPVSYCLAERFPAGGAGDRLVGYVVFWIVAGEAHILTIAVDPGFRRRGFARALVSHTLAFMEDAGVAEVSLEVRRSNATAISLYTAFGFREAYVRTRYYGDEDAIVMRKELGHVGRGDI